MTQPTKYISYASGQWTIADVKIPNSYMQEHYPDYAMADNVKSFYYKSDLKAKNKIAYTDNSEEELVAPIEKYEDLLISRYTLEFNYGEYVKEQKKLQTAPALKYNIRDVFVGDRAQREATLLAFEQERNISPISDERLNEWLKYYKIKKLDSSDWTQLPDTELTPEEVEAWKAYRKDLRKLNKTDDPIMVNLPVPPEDS